MQSVQPHQKCILYAHAFELRSLLGTILQFFDMSVVKLYNTAVLKM